jgi:16S rRNA processing protein RimM
MLDIGKIVGTHGLRGDLKVRPNFGDPGLLLEIEEVFLRLPTGEQLIAEPCRQSLHKGQVLLRLRGLESLSQVERLVGGSILLPKEQLPELTDDEYYWHQLDGLQVFDKHYGEIGRLKGLYSTAAHDTYIVRGDYGEVLIPAVEQFIVEIDLEQRLMRVELPEGLVPEKK